jgi:hypothetical protein
MIFCRAKKKMWGIWLFRRFFRKKQVMVDNDLAMMNDDS